MLGPGTIAAHCVHVADREIELLAESGTVVAHNPQSNMNNAVGVADVIALVERGVLVGLGTDAMTTNMLEELRAAMWVQPPRGLPSVGFVRDGRRADGRATRGSPAACGACALGELRPGAAADMVLLDYDPPTPLDAETVAGHLVFGMSQAPVATTIAAGAC